jgi:hypothetical protein
MASVLTPRVAELQPMGTDEVLEVAGCDHANGMPRPPEPHPEGQVRLHVTSTTQRNDGDSQGASTSWLVCPTF